MQGPSPPRRATRWSSLPLRRSSVNPLRRAPLLASAIGNCLANADFDEALRQLHENPAGVERMAAIDRELERRRALFDEAPDATPKR